MIVDSNPSKSIELANVGPIERLSIPVPAGGGVVVLHGRSGAGKTHAIAAVGALSDEKLRKSLRASDGIPSGKIEGLGVTVRLGRSNTVKGELECESLESGVDPSLLVDPGIKDPLAADSKRLATLIRLAGVKVSADQWAQTIGESADEIALKDLVSDDPVTSADKIRRRLHDVALTKERLRDSKANEAAALSKSIADVDLTLPDDEAALKRQYEVTFNELIESRQKIAAYNRALAAQSEAKSQMDALTAVDQSRLTRLAEVIEDRRKQIESSELQIKEYEDFIAGERQRIDRFKMDIRVATSETNELIERSSKLAKLSETVSAALPETVSQEKLATLEAFQVECQRQMQAGEVVRRAKQTKAKAEKLAKEAFDEHKNAEKLRDLARSTDSVLEQALVDAGFDTIKVHDGRLCVKSDRGLEPVSELSTGERWRLALDLAAKGLKPGALLSVQQEGWQSLDYELRREVAAMARERGLVIVTAAVDEGELRAEVV